MPALFCIALAVALAVAYAVAYAAAKAVRWRSFIVPATYPPATNKNAATRATSEYFSQFGMRAQIKPLSSPAG